MLTVTRAAAAAALPLVAAVVALRVVIVIDRLFEATPGVVGEQHSGPFPVAKSLTPISRVRAARRLLPDGSRPPVDGDE